MASPPATTSAQPLGDASYRFLQDSIELARKGKLESATSRHVDPRYLGDERAIIEEWFRANNLPDPYISLPACIDPLIISIGDFVANSHNTVCSESDPYEIETISSKTPHRSTVSTVRNHVNATTDNIEKNVAPATGSLGNEIDLTIDSEDHLMDITNIMVDSFSTSNGNTYQPFEEKKGTPSPSKLLDRDDDVSVDCDGEMAVSVMFHDGTSVNASPEPVGQNIGRLSVEEMDTTDLQPFAFRHYASTTPSPSRWTSSSPAFPPIKQPSGGASSQQASAHAFRPSSTQVPRYEEPSAIRPALATDARPSPFPLLRLPRPVSNQGILSHSGFEDAVKLKTKYATVPTKAELQRQSNPGARALLSSIEALDAPEGSGQLGSRSRLASILAGSDRAASSGALPDLPAAQTRTESTAFPRADLTLGCDHSSRPSPIQATPTLAASAANGRIHFSSGNSPVATGHKRRGKERDNAHFLDDFYLDKLFKDSPPHEVNILMMIVRYLQESWVQQLDPEGSNMPGWAKLAHLYERVCAELQGTSRHPPYTSEDFRRLIVSKPTLFEIHVDYWKIGEEARTCYHVRATPAAIEIFERFERCRTTISSSTPNPIQRHHSFPAASLVGDGDVHGNDGNQKQNVARQMTDQMAGITETHRATEPRGRSTHPQASVIGQSVYAEVNVSFERGRRVWEWACREISDEAIRGIMLDFALSSARKPCDLDKETKWFRKPTCLDSDLARRFAIESGSSGNPIGYFISELVRLRLFRNGPYHLQITPALLDLMLFLAGRNGHHALMDQARRDDRFKHLFAELGRTATDDFSAQADPAPPLPAGNFIPSNPPAAYHPLLTGPTPMRRSPGVYSQASAPAQSFTLGAVHERNSHSPMIPTPVNQYQTFGTGGPSQNSPTLPAIHWPSNTDGRYSPDVASDPGRFAFSLSTANTSRATSGSGEPSRALVESRDTVQRSSDWWNVMNTIDNLQNLDLHRHASLPQSPYGTGWVKDTNILGCTGVRPDLTPAGILEMLAPSFAEGLIVMATACDINRRIHYYFQTSPKFRLQRDSRIHSTTVGYPADSIADLPAEPSRNRSARGGDVRAPRRLRRGSTPEQLMSRTAKKSTRPRATARRHLAQGHSANASSVTGPAE